MWHPDKNISNPEKFREQFMLLNESYKIYKQGPGNSQDSGNFSNTFSAEDLLLRRHHKVVLEKKK